VRKGAKGRAGVRKKNPEKGSKGTSRQHSQIQGTTTELRNKTIQGN